jgi:RNA polymerase sigma-70 factor (ECF subfamily)
MTTDQTGQITHNELLLRLLKMGDQFAFEKIFRANYNRIFGFCERFIDDNEAIRSIALEAFVNLWVNRDKIEKPGGIQAFLYTFARSGCLNYLRNRKIEKKYFDRRLHELESLLNIEVLSSFDFKSLEFTELEKLIIDSVSELPEKCRLVFIKSRYEGKSNIEIANELTISEKSVEAHITRALKSLRLKLSDYLPLVLVQMILHSLS